MAKILTVDELICAVSDSNMLDGEEYIKYVIDAVQIAAERLAQHHGIIVGETTFEDASVMTSFYLKEQGQKGPAVIGARDLGGDWEVKEVIDS